MSRERTSSGSWLATRVGATAPTAALVSSWLALGLIVGCSGPNYSRGLPDAGGSGGSGEGTGGAGLAGSGGTGSGGAGPVSSGGAGLTSSGGANPGSGGMASGGRGGTGGTPGSGGAGTGGAIGGGPGRTGGITGAGGAGTSSGGRGTGGANTGGANTGGANTGGMGAAAPAGAILYYPFDETTGTSVADQSGNARTGTVTGGGTFGAGMIQNGLTFLGGSTTATRTYVTVPVGLLTTTSDMTISLWVKIQTEQTWQRIFDFSKSSTTGYMFLTTRAQAGMRFAITTTGNLAEQQLDGPTLPVGAWKHVALVLGSGGASIFVDGAKVATNAALTLRPADIGLVTNQWLGRSSFSGDPYFAGQLDELRIYGRALSDAEIGVLYSLR